VRLNRHSVGAEHPRRALTGYLLLLLCAVATGACAAQQMPQIQQVSPSHINFGTSAQLLVIGSGFGRDDALSLNGVALPETTWVNSSMLTARIGTDLGAGTYDVTVKTVDGQSASKPKALVIQQMPIASQATTPTPTPRPTPSPTPSPRPTRRPTPAPTETPAILPTATAIVTVPARPPAAFDVSGRWSVVDTVQDNPSVPRGIVFPNLNLVQSGNEVTGSGDSIASLQGTITGRTLVANFTQTDGTTGQFVWTFSPNDTTFSGMFATSTASHGVSDGRLLGRGP
jgi:hypothetical protein